MDCECQFVASFNAKGYEGIDAAYVMILRFFSSKGPALEAKVANIVAAVGVYHWMLQQNTDSRQAMRNKILPMLYPQPESYYALCDQLHNWNVEHCEVFEQR